MSVRAGEKNVHHFAHPPNLACEKSQRVERAYQNYQKQIKRDCTPASIGQFSEG